MLFDSEKLLLIAGPCSLESEPVCRAVAEKLRSEVAAAPAPVPVTVSVGVATWAQETPEELLRRADAALYRAKDAGRDRVMAATLHGRT